jgi:hypothetical protein
MKHTFSTRSAPVNIADNPSLKPFISKLERFGQPCNTPHGYNHGGTTVDVECKKVAENMHIRFPDNQVLWAHIYETPDGDTLAVRHRAGGPRQIGILEFYKKADFGFTVEPNSHLD